MRSIVWASPLQDRRSKTLTSGSHRRASVKDPPLNSMTNFLCQHRHQNRWKRYVHRQDQSTPWGDVVVWAATSYSFFPHQDSRRNQLMLLIDWSRTPNQRKQTTTQVWSGIASRATHGLLMLIYQRFWYRVTYVSWSIVLQAFGRQPQEDFKINIHRRYTCTTAPTQPWHFSNLCGRTNASPVRFWLSRLEQRTAPTTWLRDNFE